MQLQLIEFIKENKNWEEVLKSAPYYISINRDDGYIIFKYNQLMSDFNNPIVRECRGIILKESDFSIVCHPFDKFGNAGEEYCPEIDWESASVQQKVDGSLMKVWFDNGWHISTNGTIDAFKADLQSAFCKSFGALFLKAIKSAFKNEHDFFKYLNKKYTYMFELVSPYNRVVIPYYDTELYFLGVRDNITQQEYMPETTKLFKLNKFKIPSRYSLSSYEEVKNAANILSWDEEGYVVCDKSFNRVKIKSPEYVKAHYIRNNNSVSASKLMSIILSGEENEFLIYASDYKEDLNRLKGFYQDSVELIKTYAAELDKMPFENPKERALYIQSHYAKELQHFLYKDTIKKLESLSADKWVDLLKSRGLLE